MDKKSNKKGKTIASYLKREINSQRAKCICIIDNLKVQILSVLLTTLKDHNNFPEVKGLCNRERF